MERFVDDWYIVDTLGEGAYGEVKLLLHATSEDTVAVKILNLKDSREARENFIKEERIHRLLHHPSIIQLLGKREEKKAEMAYLFLEFASGGELFDKIEPDVGMASNSAQKYFRQLLEGLSYLHTKGITHRDIKPENLLLDEMDNLKISDFGMATIFRLKGRERLLDRRCGTLPYIAPEVLVGPYHAQPADIWSCGIVLVAMLSGELPWSEPAEDNEEFTRWIESSCITESTWSKMSTMAFSLVRKILAYEPKNRLTIEQIFAHTWMKTNFGLELDVVDSAEPRAKRAAVKTDSSCPEKQILPLSQPMARIPMIEPACLSSLLAKKPTNLMSFSQPTQIDDLLLNSQSITQSQVSTNLLQMLLKRMTRFKMKTTYKDTMKHICQTLDALEYSYTISPAGSIIVSIIDRRKMQLVFRIIALDADDHILVDFRFSKGCGIEFKRRFLKIKDVLSDLRVQ